MSKVLSFEWDEKKDHENKVKHHVSFAIAQEAFFDPNRIITIDELHNDKEERYFCIGKVNNRIVTVRFTVRQNKIRIYGAGFWRKGKKYYEKENTNN